MSHRAVLTQRLSPLATGTDPGGETPSGTGVNVLHNSKWQGAGPPTNWSIRKPGEGAYVLSAGDIADHQTVQFTSTDPSYNDSALYQQNITVTAGEFICISATVRAVSGSSPEGDPYVIMNHTPFEALNLVTSRPSLETAVVGQVSYYIAQAATSGTVTILYGVDRTGSVTLEAPMVDKFNGLRNYTATDPMAEPISTLAALPWRGDYIGLPVAANGNNVYLLNSNSTLFGHLLYIPVSGTLRKVQWQLASNFTDQGTETSKSRYQNNNPHSYPAVFNLRSAIDRLNASFVVSSANVWTTDYTYTNPDGASNNSRVIVSFNPNLAVTGDTYLSLRHVNLDTASETYCAVNSIQNSLTVGLGAVPARRNDRWHGDYPYPVRGNITGVVNSMILGVAYEIEAADGNVYTQGVCHYDATNSYLGVVVGGSQRVRQSWTYGLYHRASSVVLAARWATSSTPPDDLTMRITGPDIATTTVDIPAATFNGIGTNPFDTYVVSLGTTLTFSPNTTYTVELYAPSATTSNGYRINSIREYRNGIATASLINPLPSVSQAPIDLNSWGATNGGMQRSTNGGSSWADFNNSNLPWALFTNGNVSATLGGLT